MTSARGISEDNRRLLEVLHRQVHGPFSVAGAAEVWRLDPTRAGRLLAHLAARGWLARIRRGSYALVPLGATSPGDRREDPCASSCSELRKRGSPGSRTASMAATISLASP